MSTKRTDTAVPEETENRTERYIRRSREEAARLAEGHRPFSYEEWQRKAPPATPEELAETEEFLQQRNLEREGSIAAEAGLYLGGAPDAAPDKEPQPDPGE